MTRKRAITLWILFFLFLLFLALVGMMVATTAGRPGTLFSLAPMKQGLKLSFQT